MKKNGKFIIICSLVIATILLSTRTYSYFRGTVGADVIGTIDNLVLNENEDVVTGKLNHTIIPEENSGKFSFIVDFTGSTNSANMAFSINGDNLPKNIEFYTNSDYTENLSQKIYNIKKSNSMSQIITIYWRLDENDSLFISKTIDITINCVATTSNS